MLALRAELDELKRKFLIADEAGKGLGRIAKEYQDERDAARAELDGLRESVGDVEELAQQMEFIANNTHEVIAEIIERDCDQAAIALRRLAARNAELEARLAWLPIENAPKGMPSLLWSAKSGSASIGDWGRFCIHNEPRFTYYQPLPTPPTTGAANG